MSAFKPYVFSIIFNDSNKSDVNSVPVNEPEGANRPSVSIVTPQVVSSRSSTSSSGTSFGTIEHGPLIRAQHDLPTAACGSHAHAALLQIKLGCGLFRARFQLPQTFLVYVR